MVQQFRGLTALGEDWASVPSTHMAHDYLQLQFQETQIALHQVRKIVVNTQTHSHIHMNILKGLYVDRWL